MLRPMNQTDPAPKPPLSRLNGIFIRALKALGEAGQTDLASRLAAEGWKEIRHESPEEAERLNGALHWLNRTARPDSPQAGGKGSQR